jgi:hypothetical protein
VTAVFVAGLIASGGDSAVVAYAAYAAVGGLLIVLRPRNIVGWLLIGIGLGILGMTRNGGLDVEALGRGAASFTDRAWAWYEGWSGQGTFLGLIALLTVYPEGRLPPQKALARTLIGLAAFLTVLAAIAPTISVGIDAVTFVPVPNPLGILPNLGAVRFVTTAAGDIYGPIGLTVAAVVLTIARYRRATGALRLQLRWLIAAITAVGAAVFLGAVVLTAVGDAAGDLVWIPALFAFPTVPVAIAIAVLRFRLYDIDLVLRRTAAYALLTALLAGLYAGAVVVFQRILRSLTGQDSELALVASTLLLAAVFNPMRRIVQRSIDRRFDRPRLAAEQAFRALAPSLRTEVVPAHLASVLAEAVDQGFRPAHVSLWLREDAVDEGGTAVPETFPRRRADNLGTRSPR